MVAVDGGVGVGGGSGVSGAAGTRWTVVDPGDGSGKMRLTITTADYLSFLHFQAFMAYCGEQGGGGGSNGGDGGGGGEMGSTGALPPALLPPPPPALSPERASVCRGFGGDDSGGGGFGNGGGGGFLTDDETAPDTPRSSAGMLSPGHWSVGNRPVSTPHARSLAGFGFEKRPLSLPLPQRRLKVPASPARGGGGDNGGGSSSRNGRDGSGANRSRNDGRNTGDAGWSRSRSPLRPDRRRSCGGGDRDDGDEEGSVMDEDYRPRDASV
ncbi:unnamed protein product [Phaeothamnion confervicola]